MNGASHENKILQKYLTLSQKNELLQFVGDNYSLLFDRKTHDVIKQNQWQLISIKLNAMGPMKTADGWKRCFTTLKAATKAKYVAQLPLNDTELNISQMCHMNALDVSREQSKKARKPRKAADSQREIERRPPSNQISAAAATSDHANSSIQIANIPIEETGTYANTSQKSRLVRVIKYNYSALFGKISTQLGADSLKGRIWTLLTWQLNTLGPKKDVKGWQTCFNYLKSKTKEKLTAIRQYKMRHGVSPADIELSEIESEIIEMCNIDTLDGNSKVVELGLGDPYATSVRVRPKSTVVSSTVVSSMVPATISENACNESEESFETLSNDERDELMNVIFPTKSLISSCQEVNAQGNLSKPPKILSVRSLRDVDESVDESYTLNQAPTVDFSCEAQQLSYETLMADAAINETIFAAQGNVITTEAAREKVSLFIDSNQNS